MIEEAPKRTNEQENQRNADRLKGRQNANKRVWRGSKEYDNALKSFEQSKRTMQDYYTYMGDSRGTIYIPDNMWPLVFRYDEPKTVIVKADSTDSMTAALRAE